MFLATKSQLIVGQQAVQPIVKQQAQNAQYNTNMPQINSNKFNNQSSHMQKHVYFQQETEPNSVHQKNLSLYSQGQIQKKDYKSGTPQPLTKEGMQKHFSHSEETPNMNNTRLAPKIQKQANMQNIHYQETELQAKSQIKLVAENNNENVPTRDNLYQQQQYSQNDGGMGGGVEHLATAKFDSATEAADQIFNKYKQQFSNLRKASQTHNNNGNLNSNSNYNLVTLNPNNSVSSGAQLQLNDNSNQSYFVDEFVNKSKKDIDLSIQDLNLKNSQYEREQNYHVQDMLPFGKIAQQQERENEDAQKDQDQIIEKYNNPSLQQFSNMPFDEINLNSFIGRAEQVNAQAQLVQNNKQINNTIDNSFKNNINLTPKTDLTRQQDQEITQQQRLQNNFNQFTPNQDLKLSQFQKASASHSNNMNLHLTPGQETPIQKIKNIPVTGMFALKKGNKTESEQKLSTQFQKNSFQQIDKNSFHQNENTLEKQQHQQYSFISNKFVDNNIQQNHSQETNLTEAQKIAQHSVLSTKKKLKDENKNSTQPQATFSTVQKNNKSNDTLDQLSGFSNLIYTTDQTNQASLNKDLGDIDSQAKKYINSSKDQVGNSINANTNNTTQANNISKFVQPCKACEQIQFSMKSLEIENSQLREAIKPLLLNVEMLTAQKNNTLIQFPRYNTTTEIVDKIQELIQKLKHFNDAYLIKEKMPKNIEPRTIDKILISQNESEEITALEKRQLKQFFINYLSLQSICDKRLIEIKNYETQMQNIQNSLNQSKEKFISSNHSKLKLLNKNE